MGKSVRDSEQTIKQPYTPGPPSKLLAHRKALIILAHVVAFALSLMFSFLVASNMQFRRDWLIEQFPTMVIVVLVVKLVVFSFFEQYRGWWRYASITDLFGIIRASLVSTLIIFVLWGFFLSGAIEGILNTIAASMNWQFEVPLLRRQPFFEGLVGINQGVFIADLFGTIMILAGMRMSVRLYYEEFRTVESGRLKHFLIVGAGNAGEALLREIHRMPVAQYDVIGFIDDDPNKQGSNIHGIPVLGTVEQLPRICEEKGIEEIAIAMPSSTHQELRRVVQICEGTKVRFRTVPSITDIASGRLRVSQIRDVDINDLLGRAAVQLDLNLIEDYLHDKVILVTGAGGSIGSEMCRQVCNFEPGHLLLVEQAENPLFDIERELRSQFPNIKMTAVIADITDKPRVEQIFEYYQPKVIIHAAAHKHVPLMETNPGEPIKNNVIGTRTVADAADKYKATNFVMISTDKAVNPTSLMGSSKRVAEMYIQSLNNNSETHFVTVRFGNVLGSNGSVVPIFKKQIAEGGPVTVTHPEMKRYFMTIPEASQLVLQAAAMGKGGEIFVLDMGEPVKIVDLARELITLSGFKPGEDIDITFVGTRPGEKLFEELSISGEDMLPTRHPKIGIWKTISVERGRLLREIDELVNLAQTQDRGLIIKEIKQLIPEYTGDLQQ